MTKHVHHDCAKTYHTRLVRGSHMFYDFARA